MTDATQKIDQFVKAELIALKGKIPKQLKKNELKAAKGLAALHPEIKEALAKFEQYGEDIALLDKIHNIVNYAIKRIDKIRDPAKPRKKSTHKPFTKKNPAAAPK